MGIMPSVDVTQSDTETPHIQKYNWYGGIVVGGHTRKEENTPAWESIAVSFVIILNIMSSVSKSIHVFRKGSDI